MTAWTDVLVLAVQVPRPLDNPLIFGDFYVAFSSTQRTSQQNTQRTLNLALVLLRTNIICLFPLRRHCLCT